MQLPQRDPWLPFIVVMCLGVLLTLAESDSIRDAGITGAVLFSPLFMLLVHRSYCWLRGIFGFPVR